MKRARASGYVKLPEHDARPAPVTITRADGTVEVRAVGAAPPPCQRHQRPRCWPCSLRFAGST